jgi:hypothetical protein
MKAEEYISDPLSLPILLPSFSCHHILMKPIALTLISIL